MAEQDLQTAGVQDIGMLHTIGQIAMQPAQGRLLNAQAGEAEQKLANEQKMSAVMAQMAQGGSAAGSAPGGVGASAAPLSSMFAKLATSAFQSGLPEQASKYATVAGTLARQDVQNISSLATAQKAKIEADHKRWDTFERLTRGVEDQAGLDAANANYVAQTGEASPFAGMQYSPERMTTIRDLSISRKDALQEQLRRDQLAERTAKDAATADYRTARRDQFERTTRVAEQREERLAKNGGRPVTAPSKAEFTPALELVQAEIFPGGKGAEGANLEQAKLAAADLASEAKRRTMANRGLDYQTALHQAFEESKARGDWQDLKTETMFGLGPDSITKKYSPTGNTPERALAIPAKKDELKAGRFYRNGNGQVAKWNGSKFEAGAAPAGSRTLPAYQGASVSATAPDESELETEE